MIAQALEIAGADCERAAGAVELFIRSSTVLPRRPAVLVMDAMPDLKTTSIKAVMARNNRWVLVGRCPPPFVVVAGGGEGGNLIYFPLMKKVSVSFVIVLARPTLLTVSSHLLGDVTLDGRHFDLARPIW